jgi:hypothetical protein
LHLSNWHELDAIGFIDVAVAAVLVSRVILVAIVALSNAANSLYTVVVFRSAITRGCAYVSPAQPRALLLAPSRVLVMLQRSLGAPRVLCHMPRDPSPIHSHYTRCRARYWKGGDRRRGQWMLEKPLLSPPVPQGTAFRVRVDRG